MKMKNRLFRVGENLLMAIFWICGVLKFWELPTPITVILFCVSMLLFVDTFMD